MTGNDHVLGIVALSHTPALAGKGALLTSAIGAGARGSNVYSSKSQGILPQSMCTYLVSSKAALWLLVEVTKANQN